MATATRFDRTVLVAAAATHLAVGASHEYSHSVAHVPITALQRIFIVVIVTIGPLASALIAMRRDLRLGAGLFSASMVMSFAFGYLLHFVIDTPDLHTNVVGEHAEFFFHSALSLALIQFLGFAFGLVVVLRRAP